MDDKSAAFVFATHDQARDAIAALGKSGFDVKKLSLVGRGYHTEEQPVGFYTAGDRIKAWGRGGAFWGGVWGLLLAPAVFFLPGFGLVMMAGPFVAALVAALEGAIVVGGISAIAAALTKLGFPDKEVVKYESAVKADKFLLVVHGTEQDLATVRSALIDAI